MLPIIDVVCYSLLLGVIVAQVYLINLMLVKMRKSTRLMREANWALIRKNQQISQLIATVARLNGELEKSRDQSSLREDTEWDGTEQYGMGGD